MANFKTYPVFYSLLIAVGVIAVGEGYFIYNRSSAAAKATKILNQKNAERRSLQEVNPFPTDDNRISIEKDLAATQLSFEAMRAELKGRGPVAEKMYSAVVPAEPTDAYFDLATFVQKAQERLISANIEVKPDYRFGFSDYASAGPERDLVSAVFRQRQVMDYLVDAIVASTPQRLVSVQREQPVSKSDKVTDSNTPSPQNDGASDIFSIDPRISARVEGFIATTGFRVAMVGTTETLRSFLNIIGKFEIPLVVRSVEVEPAVSEASADVLPAEGAFGEVASAAAPPAPKPIVEKVLSKFTVTIELIDLVHPETSKSAPATSS